MKLKLVVPKTEHYSMLDRRLINAFMDKPVWFAPLSIPLIAGLTPQDVETEILDENVAPIDFDTPADLVGITATTSLACSAYRVADEFRARGVKVVLGGIHPSVLPDEAGRHADCVVVGEAEPVWEKLIADFRAGRLAPRYRAENRADLSRTPVPRWDLLTLDAYRAMMLQVTRGCPYDCAFCSVKGFFGAEYRFKPLENVRNELAALKSLGIRGNFIFADDNFAANPQYTRELCGLLREMGFRNWQAQVSVNVDVKLLPVLASAGCSLLMMGLESVSQHSLDRMGKGTVNHVDKYAEVIDLIHANGMSVMASFIAGSDHDAPGYFDAIRRFVERTGIEIPLVSLLTPFPGTRIEKQLREEGRILTTDWSKYDLTHVCYQPKTGTAEELRVSAMRVNVDFYETGAMYRRMRRCWKRGVFYRKLGVRRYLFSRKRWSLTFAALLFEDIQAGWFVLRALWHIPNPRFFIIQMGLAFRMLSRNIDLSGAENEESVKKPAA